VGPRDLEFDRQLVFLGGEPERAAVRVGDRLSVRTFWRRRETIDRVFISVFALLDERNRPVLETAGFIGGLSNPVYLWPSDAIVRTTYRIIVPETLEAGRYTLVMRLGDWDGQAAALATCDAPEVVANRMFIKIGQVEITRS
jgi:hypothetical protein